VQNGGERGVGLQWPTGLHTLGAMGVFSRRVLALLQFTRFALVFTAISNAQAALMLYDAPGNALDPMVIMWVALVSIGLYTFGMSLNDIIDRRRDAQLAADRPLPSGRISVQSAHVVCALLLGLAVLGGVMLSLRVDRGQLTMVVLVGVVALIVFYDVMGKYLVPLGLVSLGLIRFFQATIAAPTVPVLWHPLLLLNHVVILSALAYHWEQKRPALQKRHVVEIACLLAVVNTALITVLAHRRGPQPGSIMTDLLFDARLIYPAATVIAALVIAILIRRRNSDPRAAGKTLMLVGLLWLIVYDAAFVLAYVGLKQALMIFALLPIAWLGVRLTRLWAKVSALSDRPQYIRAGR
jgi:4-hydroxybenzoate polyprenyltransferase